MPDYALSSVPLGRGRLTVYRRPERYVTYAAGIDFAYGLDGGDYDACTILDEYGEQCAVLHGHWGPDLLPDALRPLLDWYDLGVEGGGVFIVGERQVGLSVLRQLWDDGRWLYFARAEEHRNRPERDSVGHHKSHVDHLMANLRKALRTKPGPDGKPVAAIRVRDAATLAELKAFQFLPRGGGGTIEGLRDEDLAMGAPPGEHDDLVNALAYAWMGLRECGRFKRPAPKHAPGTMGSIARHDDVWQPSPPLPSKLLAARGGKTSGV